VRNSGYRVIALTAALGAAAAVLVLITRWDSASDVAPERQRIGRHPRPDRRRPVVVKVGSNPAQVIIAPAGTPRAGTAYVLNQGNGQPRGRHPLPRRRRRDTDPR